MTALDNLLAAAKAYGEMRLVASEAKPGTPGFDVWVRLRTGAQGDLGRAAIAWSREQRK